MRKIVIYIALTFTTLPISIALCLFLLFIFQPAVQFQAIYFFVAVSAGAFLSGVYTTLFFDYILSRKPKTPKDELPDNKG